MARKLRRNGKHDDRLYEAEIGEKIKGALDGMAFEIDRLRAHRKNVLEAWGEGDYEWLAEYGIITQAELRFMQSRS